MDYFIHPGAIVETNHIGKNTRIWAFTHILEGAVIGAHCNICDFCFIEGQVKMGDRVTVKSGIYIWNGVEIEDDVFLGPNVVFTNDIRPRSKQYVAPVRTLIAKGASIGANSTILAGVTIGRYAMSGIGSVITRDVPPHALVYGNPARRHGWVDEQGNKLEPAGKELWKSSGGVLYRETPDGLLPAA